MPAGVFSITDAVGARTVTGVTYRNVAFANAYLIGADAGVPGGKYVTHDGTDVRDGGLTIDAAGSAADCEILALVYAAAQPPNFNFKGTVYVRALDFTTGSQDLICAGLQTTSTPVDQLAVRKLVAGVQTGVASNTFTWNLATYYAVRLRIAGTTVTAKVWLPANLFDPVASEPAAWTVTGTVADVVGAGWVGFGQRDHATSVERWVPLGWATGGDTAPAPVIDSRGLNTEVAYVGVWSRALSDVEIAALGQVAASGLAVTQANQTLAASGVVLPPPGVAPPGEWPDGATLPITVELLLGSVWTDITDDVSHDDGVVHERGQRDWAAHTDHSTCSMVLFNEDGRYSSRNPFGPYYGLLGRHTQLRVSLAIRGVKYYRFWGEVSSWPQQWDATGTQVRVPITATGPVARLQQTTRTVQSVLRRQIPKVLTHLECYWPLEDKPGRTRLAAALPECDDMRRHSDAAPSLAAYDGFDASAPILTLNDADLRGNVPRYHFPGGGAEVQLGFLLHVEGESTAGQTLAHLEMSGTAQQWEIRYETADGGSLQVRVKREDGTEIHNSGTMHTQINNRDWHVFLRLQRVSDRIRYELHLLRAGASEGIEHQGAFVTNASLGRVDQVVLNWGGGHSSVSIGHVTVQSQAQSFLRIVGPLAAYEGERAGRRIQRLLDEHDQLPFNATGDLDDTERMGPQRVGALLDLVQEAAATDHGVLFETRHQFGVGYRTRASLYNQEPQVEFDYDAQVLSAPLEPVEDLQGVTNDITATGVRGEARAVLNTGALSVKSPPAGIGRVEDQLPVNAEAGRFADQAAHRLMLATVDEPRYPIVKVEMSNLNITRNPVLQADILNLNVGDRFTVINVPVWLPAGPISQLAFGWVERFTKFSHEIEFRSTPESPYRTPTVGAGKVAPVESVLAATAAVGAASLSVETTAGDLWSTAAANYPTQILVAGIPVTVTAVSGTSSPQTFTVTGATVTKALPGGSTVELYDPGRVRL
jgi:hypothetical protein